MIASGGGGGGERGSTIFNTNRKKRAHQDVYYIISSVLWNKQRKQTKAQLKPITHITLVMLQTNIRLI